MKFTFLALLGFTTILGTSLIQISCNTAGTKTANASSNDGGKGAIVYVNSDSLLDKYDYYKKVKKTLDDKQQSAQIDAEQKQRGFQIEVDAYKKNAFNLTPVQKKTEEDRLGKEGQQIQAFQQNLSQELAAESQDLNDKLNTHIRLFLESFSKNNHYQMVLGYSTKGGTLLYAQPGLDVTHEVIKGLNEAYAKEK